MRTRVVLGAVAVAVVVGGAVLLWSAGDDAPSGADPSEPPPIPLAGEPTSADAFAPQMVGYDLAEPLPEMGGTGTVYRLVPPPISDAELVEMAAAVGVEGTVTESDGQRVVTNSSGEVELHRGLGQWGVSYRNTSWDRSAMDPGGPPPDVPEGDDLERIGRDLVSTLGVDADGWRVLTEGGGVTTGFDSQVYGRTASFDPVFDGVAYFPLGWTVNVIDGGVVGHASGSVSDWVAVGDYPLRPAPDAYDDLVEGTALMPFHSGIHGVDLGDVTITEVELSIAMFAGSHAGEEVGYLVPIYLFSADVADEDSGVQFEVAAVEPRFFEPTGTTSGD